MSHVCVSSFYAPEHWVGLAVLVQGYSVVCCVGCVRTDCTAVHSAALVACTIWWMYPSVMTLSGAASLVVVHYTSSVFVQMLTVMVELVRGLASSSAGARVRAAIDWLVFHCGLVAVLVVRCLLDTDTSQLMQI